MDGAWDAKVDHEPDGTYVVHTDFFGNIPLTATELVVTAQLVCSCLRPGPEFDNVEQGERMTELLRLCKQAKLDTKELCESAMVFGRDDEKTLQIWANLEAILKEMANG